MTASKPLAPAILCLFTILLGSVPVYTPLARAVPGPPGGVTDPANIWAPYGPMTTRLQYNYYADENGEFTAFELGNIDVGDWPVPKGLWASYDNNPDLVLGQAQGEFGMFQIDLNHESSTWTLWGCDFVNGNSPCGAQIRQAITHLVDRPRFVIDSVLGGAGQALADPTPPAKTPAGSTVATQQSWDTLHVTINAYNIASDEGGFATPGSPDFCAARDHLLAAGVGFVDANNNCVIDNPGVAQTYPIRFMIRNDHPPRNALGIGLMNAINQLFGADVVAEFFGNINQIGDAVFISDPATDDWDMYTGGWSLGGPFPDHLRALYSSPFASNFCGGKRDNRPLNYGFVCVPDFDTHINASSQTDNLSTFGTETLLALNELGKRGAVIPIYSGGNRWVALRDVAGLVDQRGIGYPNFWTTLNGRENPAYTPVNPAYAFGGGNPGTLRWGQKQGTTKLNIFHASTLWDFNVLSEIYDTLIATSPVEPEKIISWMANRYTLSVDVSGNTHIIFDLRADLRWHDGQPLTAADVKFTILNYRDVPATNLVTSVALVKNVIVQGPLKVEIILQGRSVSHLLNMGVPIIPKHIWDTNNDGVADPEKVDPSFDPLAAGILIGSGPFVCRSVFPIDLGRIGTGCGRNADGSRAGQVLAPGASLLLEKFDFATPANPFTQYMRSYNAGWPAGGSQSGQYQEWSWADRDNDGRVTLIDVTSVASCFGTGPSANCPADVFAYWDRLTSPGVVSIEAVTVAAHFDDTWTSPFAWDPSVLANIQPFAP